MRAVLFGAGGMLGRDLVGTAPRGVELTPCARADADITDPAAVARALRTCRPDVVLNCAAYTSVDRAEAEPEAAWAANAEGPAVIGRTAREAAAPPLVIHFSTDYVFDGAAREPYSEDSPTAPLGVYGASKLAGERALAASGAPCCVIRTQWLFGLAGRSFPRTMWERAMAGSPTRVVSDQWGRPTFTTDLARVTWQLVLHAGRELSRHRVLHVANRGVATWHDVAARVFGSVGAGPLLTACTTAEYPTPARRPRYSVLDLSRVAGLPGGTIPSWDDALRRFLASLGAAAPA
ncbi:MAG TPA: dTDP-4-dehydrorhamnose reductase [Gemmatimonadales bacterium]|nr:dTDP-4-dehydrorhamnose reductase [Gemmatimonadales bacterium]